MFEISHGAPGKRPCDLSVRVWVVERRASMVHGVDGALTTWWRIGRLAQMED